MLVCFFEIISWHAPNKLLVENPFVSALCIHSFIQQCYKQRTAWKAFTINPAITENMQCTIVKACTPVIDIEVGVSCLNTVYHIWWLWLWLNTGKGSACIPGQCIHYTKINLESIKWLSNKDLKQLSELLFILRFVSLPALQKFGYHSKQRITLKTPLLALLLRKSHTKAI